MVGRIYHVGLTVSDLDKSIAFYRDILGLKYQDVLLAFCQTGEKSRSQLSDSKDSHCGSEYSG